MKDRIPSEPGRVFITPENGTAPYYATMTRADNPTQEGTPLNKASLLKDATATMFGLGADAVPDDALAFLGKYNQHWWKMIPRLAYDYYHASEKKITTSVNVIAYSKTLSYSSELTINESTGEISLVNPINLRWSANAQESGEEICATLCSAAPVYVTAETSAGIYQTFRIPAGATYSGRSNAEGYTMWCYYGNSKQLYFCGIEDVGNEAITASEITTEVVHVPAEEAVYIYSSDRNAYPDDETTADDKSYKYLGIPFSNAVRAPKIEVGTYIGTGTAGEDNPTVLTFDVVPSIVFLSFTDNLYFQTKEGYELGYYFLINGVTSAKVDRDSSNISTTTLQIAWNDKTLSMYHDYATPYAGSQFNLSGKTYRYVVFGI